MSVLVAADVEALAVKAVRAALATRSDAATVATRVPNPRPVRLVRLQRLGGSRPNVVTDQALVVVHAWDARSVDAFGLARVVEAILFDLPHADDPDVWVRGVRSVGGIAFQPDPDTETPRYTFSVELNCRLVET